jgi:hypothetical protein
MAEIDFEKIAARGGSVENAFEELCCQLASKTRPAGTKFERYRGDGGDGGVECKTIDPNGSATGWQTKYVFDNAGLLKYANQSLETAMSVHTDLTCYVVCFPFDLTTKTARKGKSETEKFDEWARKAEAGAKSKGRALIVERRSASDIRGLLLANDPSGGLRHYFFFATTLSNRWFVDHVTAAKLVAGPRYNREISLETPLSGWFSSFGGDSDWQMQLAYHLDACRKEVARIADLVEAKGSNPMRPEWPTATYDQGKKLAADSKICIRSAEELTAAPTEAALSNLQASVSRLFDDLATVERSLAADLDAAHGEGSADSKRFRTFMAEYQVSFPAANLDAVREAREKWHAFSEWLSSPTGFLAFRQVFVLSGSGGAGKTHSLCDIAQRRLADGAYTCVVFGHQFGGEPDPWTRFAESLGIPLTLGREGALDALNAAAECSGKKLV